MSDLTDSPGTPRRGRLTAAQSAAREARPHLWRLFLRDFADDIPDPDEAERRAGVPQGILRRWLRADAPKRKMPPADRIAKMAEVWTHNGKAVTIAELSNALALDGGFEMSLVLDTDEQALLRAYRRLSGGYRRGVRRMVDGLTNVGAVMVPGQLNRVINEAFDEKDLH